MTFHGGTIPQNPTKVPFRVLSVDPACSSMSPVTLVGDSSASAVMVGECIMGAVTGVTPTSLALHQHFQQFSLITPIIQQIVRIA